MVLGIELWCEALSTLGGWNRNIKKRSKEHGPCTQDSGAGARVQDPFFKRFSKIHRQKPNMEKGLHEVDVLLPNIPFLEGPEE